MTDHETSLPATKPLRAAALFAGIGGFCLGFGKHGIKTEWAIENDPYAVQTYRLNFPDVRVINDGDAHASICDVSVKKFDLAKVDVLHAGFPCQSFSAAGERRGFEDPRGKLFFEIIRILKEFGDDRPPVLVFENSPYIRAGEGGSWFMEIANQIRNAGYWFRDSNVAELDCYELTPLPQQRKRLFMVAFSTHAFASGRFEFPKAGPKHNARKSMTDFINFESSLEDESYYLDEDNRYYQMIAEKALDRKSLYQLRKFFVRVKQPNVCPTLTANMGMGGHNVPFIFDQTGLRKLTEYECLQLQGFPLPPRFRFPDSVPRARRYVQIGNSVVPLVAELLAQKVRHKFQMEGLV
jgi:DNA (cytosine-5)-methyltransferase 1